MILALYDGNCRFCSWLIGQIKRFSSDITFETLDSEAGKAWKAKIGHIDSLIVIEGDTPFVLSDGVIKLLLKTKYFKLLGILLKLIPKRLRDWGYRLIANNRHCLGGNSC